MITIVGNRPEGLYIEDLQVNVPFRVSVALTSFQFERSTDLKRAINERAVRVLLGPPHVSPPMPRDPRSVAIQRENVQLRREADELKIKLQKKETESSALSAKMDAILAGLAELKGRPAVTNIVNAATGTPGVPTSPRRAAVVEDEPVHFIPEVETDGEATINVETKEGGDVKAAKNALKQLRKKQGS